MKGKIGQNLREASVLAGATTPTDVTLGLTDGTQIEITGGIEEGTTVLQYAPVARETPADGAAGGDAVTGG